ncbi:Predicted Zn-dependent peptidase [Actinobaculum suis]|uniref:Pitrilysin family protein n=1 Tax=Actinobaculum suis TaxID=1657 RepID=A0A1G6ZFP3_9ACTO|nr:pitrilysin family protein [Actinobaculum suis]MDY5153917.1 pitrilysin family protein [Actinobaculum suis]SDE01173.1 Predicted Zn-dependent peptidase [Actinobaculum suis]
MHYSLIDLPLETGHSLDLDDEGARVRRSVLPGGLRVLTSALPHVRSTHVAFWVGAGSRDETPGTEGSTHFLEHLLFKGTATRSAQDIAAESDYLGGGFNAATSKQYTCYYGHVIDEDLPQAIALLADMITSAKLAEVDFQTERGVILEELAMYADDASMVAMEKLPELVFGKHPLGRPIGGTPEDIKSLAHTALTSHYHAVYRPAELVVTAAGAVDHEDFCRRVVDALENGGWKFAATENPATRRESDSIQYPAGQDVRLQKDVEQAAVLIGMPGLDVRDERLPVLFALNAILGGGSSSRLFQEIREKRGLAYSVYSFLNAYREGGMYGLSAGCANENAPAVMELMHSELDRLARDGVSAEEVESAFRRVRADIVFSGESVNAEMQRLGTSELTRGQLISKGEHIRRARAVTAADIAELARELASGPRSSVIVGAAQ